MSNSLKRPLEKVGIEADTKVTSTATTSDSLRELTDTLIRSPKHSPSKISGLMKQLNLLEGPRSLMTKLAQGISGQLDQAYGAKHGHSHTKGHSRSGQ